MVPGYLYVNDRFFPVNLPLNRIIELFDEDPLKPLLEIQRFVETIINEKIIEAKFYKSYISRKTNIVIVEYLAKVKSGDVGIKIIYANNPSKALIEYYEAEKKN